MALISSLASSLSGMRVAQAQLEIVSNNQSKRFIIKFHKNCIAIGCCGFGYYDGGYFE